jgi:hypothetical protein
MPVHDWTRVDDGTYHDFHNGWIIHLLDALNKGVLPKGYYAQSEQHSIEYIADVLTLHVPSDEPAVPAPGGGVSVLDAPPKVSRRVQLQPPYDKLRKTLTIRRATGHRIVALIEILSPGNKSGPRKVGEFVRKATDAIRHGCHMLLVDLLPPTKAAPRGMHAAIWESWFEQKYALPKDQPLTLTSFESRRHEPVEAWIEHFALGDTLIDMPLFLREEFYVNVPLQATYDLSFDGMPEVYRAILEKPSNGKRRKR